MNSSTISPTELPVETTPVTSLATTKIVINHALTWYHLFPECREEIPDLVSVLDEEFHHLTEFIHTTDLNQKLMLIENAVERINFISEAQRMYKS